MITVEAVTFSYSLAATLALSQDSIQRPSASHRMVTVAGGALPCQCFNRLVQSFPSLSHSRRPGAVAAGQ
jgi:hypothetical protein